MQPSSLIFVVIVGVWAAFLVQYWIRRRDHIATARSVDAFTETMRVLQVRDPLPHVDLSPPRRSYAVSPTRAVRPQVTVKRAESLLAERDEGTQGGPAPEGERPAYLLAPDRSTKGLTLLVGLAGSIVYAVLSLAGVLLPWAVVAPLGLAAFGFVWLRADVLAGAAAVAPARAAAPVHGPARSRVERPVAPRAADRPASADRRAPVGRPASSSRPQQPPAPAAAPRAEEAAEAVPVLAAPRRERVFDIDQLDTAGRSAGASAMTADVPASRRASAPLLDEDDMPLTWDPVPVPRPTYTMKAQATRVTAPPVPAVPPAGLAADLDDDIPAVFPARRVVAG